MRTTWWIFASLAIALALPVGLGGCPGDEPDDDSAGDDDTGDDDTGDDDTGDDDTGDDDTGGNQPPTAPVVAIDPEAPSPSSDLTCVVTEEATDPDGDELEYNFLWTKDGESTPLHTDTVPSTATLEGEEWACYATAFDGVLVGPAGSASAVIGPYGFMLEVSLTATGGDQGGAAVVDYQHVMIDDEYTEVCRINFEFEADYTYGPAQSDDVWESVDELVTWTGGGETFNSCPETWAIYETDPVDEWLWASHPMAFVSCDQVAADEDLAATFLGEDNQGYLPTLDGTFADYCDNVAPQYASSVGAGPAEGIWLMTGEDGALDVLGSWGYFAPTDTTNVEVWLLLGLLFADSANGNEPVLGLDGDYLALPLWLWIYS